MTDNVTLNAGTGGDVIRTLDRGGIETQVMLLDIGDAGAMSFTSVSVNGTKAVFRAEALGVGRVIADVIGTFSNGELYGEQIVIEVI